MTTVKFNAGKVQYDEETKRCTPIPHKGVITIRPNPEESEFYDFVWSPKNSNSGNIEKDELLIIPGDVSFKQVVSCKTGRVFALTFLSSGAKYLYWLQDVGDDEQLDKLTERDQKIVKKVSEIITPAEEDEDEEPEPVPELAPAPEVKTEETVEPESMDVDQEKSESTPDSKPQSKPQDFTPILDLDDAFPFQLINSHLSKLSDDQLFELAKDDLPPSIAANPTRENIMDLIRSGFFSQSKSNLSGHLKKNNGAGYLLAQSFGIEYTGEGIVNFLNGIRKSSKKDKSQQ